MVKPPMSGRKTPNGSVHHDDDFLGSPDAIEAANRLAEAIEGITPHMADIAKNTSVIADNMDKIKGFFTRWLPWIIGVGGLLYPKLAQIIQSVPLPH